MVYACVCAPCVCVWRPEVNDECSLVNHLRISLRQHGSLYPEQAPEILQSPPLPTLRLQMCVATPSSFCEFWEVELALLQPEALMHC